MTSEFGDDLSGHSQRPSIPPKQIWSKADFLHQAQILARRLAVWHVDDDGPVWAPKGTDFLREVERAFRYRVLQSQHDPEATHSGPIRLLPNPSPDNSVESIAGEAVTLHSDQYRKDETIWLFRDFCEHLSQLGESEAEKLLRLKVEQLLDCRMYRRARSEVFGNYLAGHQVDQLLLDELIEAAKDAALSTMHSPNPGGQSVDSVADITAKLLSKKRMFEQFRDRFKAIESKNAFLIELRLIERCWFPSPEHRDLLHDFSEVQDSTGWKLIEQHEGTAISGNCHQVVLYVRDRDLSGSNQLPFEKWKSIAVLAGNELDKYAPVTEDRTSIRGVSGWVWWMKQLVEGGILNLPMKTKHLDEVLYLSAISAEKRDGADNKNRAEATKLMEIAERNGRVTRCTDAMTASIVLADWLSYENWPFPPLPVCHNDRVPTGVVMPSKSELPVLQSEVDSQVKLLRQVEVDGKLRDRRSIEEIERNTPALDTQSMEWIAARKENLKKLGLETNTLAKYRGAGEGGRSLSEYFGIDKDGRRWRRDSNRTPKSTVYYFLSDLKKHG